MTGPPRVRVVGHHSAPSGMGQHARSVTLALAAAGVPVAAHDVYGHWPVPATFLRDLENLRSRHGSDGPPSASDLDIYAVNADELPAVLERVPSGAKRLVFPHWELARFPEEWASRCAEFDGVWTASSLTQASIASAGVGSVQCVGLAVPTEAPAFRTRRSFGLPEDRFLVLSALHLASYWTRKNPLASLRAVLGARSGRRADSPVLVLNVAGIEHHPEAWAALSSELADGSTELVVVTEELFRGDFLALVHSCDAFLSLHRSEGFGLAIAEAMLAGKPVLATDYGGNTDFCSTAVSVPIEYRLEPVGAGEYPHADGQIWADADPDHAARELRGLIDDDHRRSALGRAARGHVLDEMSPLAVGLGYRRVLEQQ